jgi:hypothetical protein
VKNDQKAAICYLERESAEWFATARRELSNKTTRDVGRVRMVLIEECRKLLGLMKQEESQNRSDARRVAF